MFTGVRLQVAYDDQQVGRLRDGLARVLGFGRIANRAARPQEVAFRGVHS